MKGGRSPRFRVQSSAALLPWRPTQGCVARVYCDVRDAGGDDFPCDSRRLLQKLDELRLVSRAKCLLVEHTGITEEEAHHQLERTSMDARITRREAAQQVIDCYSGDATSVWRA